MLTQWSWTMKSFICHAWREQSGIELFSNRVISSSWVNLKTYIRMTGVTSYNNISQCQCHGYSYTRRRIRYHCIVRSSAVDLCLHAGIYISSVIVKIWWPKDFFSFARWMWFWYRFVAVLEPCYSKALTTLMHTVRRQRRDLLRTDWLQTEQWTRSLSSEHVYSNGSVHTRVQSRTPIQFTSCDVNAA